MTPAPSPARLDPRLTAADTAMVVVSLVIGIGIFRTPALVAASAGGAWRALAAWAIGGAASLAGALVFAEIGSRYPRPGGYYKVVAHCWNPLAAFLLNWAQVLMQGAGAAGVAIIGAEYLMRLVDGAATDGGGTSRPTATLLAAGVVAGLTALSAAGIRAGARAQNLLSLAKIALIAGLAAAGLLLAPAATGAPGGAALAGGAAGDAASTGAGAPAGMLAALVAVFYAYGGYQNVVNLSGDVRDARRRLPAGIAGGMAIVTALYLLLNAAYLRALGAAWVARSPLVAGDLARAALGPAGDAFVSLAIFVSAAGFVNATVLHVPRAYLAMADDGLLPAWLGRLNPRTQAQGPGLVFFAATALLPLLVLGSFENLLGYVMFTDALSLVALASCLFVLRRRGEGGADAWSMPGYPWLPAAFLLVLLGVAGQVLARQTRLALAGIVIVAAGLPVYAMMRGWRSRSRV
ncbi:MAG TPA: APC family permease [Patescibacteria group bacterium]|nr:APC family permease [Patescibacteria group bacterium]